MLKTLSVILVATVLAARDDPTEDPDPVVALTHKAEEEKNILASQALDVRQRYEDPGMCNTDVLCAMDAAVTGAVSEDFRATVQGGKEMHDQGIEQLCRCVIADDVTSLYEKVRHTCGDGPSSRWFKGEGKELIMHWASGRVDEGCGRVVEEKGPIPPCAWEFAAKRVAQRRMMGVLGYSNELACAWRLHGWTPPKEGHGVAQTLLRSQLEPLRETVQKQLD